MQRTAKSSQCTSSCAAQRAAGDVPPNGPFRAMQAKSVSLRQLSTQTLQTTWIPTAYPIHIFDAQSLPHRPESAARRTSHIVCVLEPHQLLGHAKFGGRAVAQQDRRTVRAIRLLAVWGRRRSLPFMSLPPAFGRTPQTPSVCSHYRCHRRRLQPRRRSPRPCCCGGFRPQAHRRHAIVSISAAKARSS